MPKRFLVFGDDWGVPLTLRHLPPDVLVGIVGAANRPRYHLPLQACAAANGLTFLVQPSGRDPQYSAFAAAVAALQPDFLLVNSYSMLIRPDVLAASTLGGANLHAALLPDYRGANPIQWALLHNELETGVTMHGLTSEIDSGDILFQRRVPIRLEDTWVDIQSRIAAATDDLLGEALPEIINGQVTGTPQEEARARRFPRRTPEDGRIDWGQSVLRIYNLIRALVKPHPGAFYAQGDSRLVLDSYRSLSQVTALKAGRGGLCMSRGSARLRPMVSTRGEGGTVGFRLSAAASGLESDSLSLCDLDYSSGTCRLICDGRSPEGILWDALAWIADYVANELELNEICVSPSLLSVASSTCLLAGRVSPTVVESKKRANIARFVG